MIEISASSSGSRHLLSVGEDLLFRFPENPTTGYRWEFRQSGTGALSLVEDLFEPGGGSGAPLVPGAGGRRTVRFVGLRPGDVHLEAVERRSWDPPAASAKTLAYVIEVR